MTKVKAAGLPSFAGLLAGWAPKGRRAEEDQPETDEERDARRAEEDERRKEEDARRAEEDKLREEEDAKRAEEDGGEDDGGEGDDAAKGGKAKKAKKADGGDDQDPEDDASDDEDDAEEDMDDKEAKAFRRGLAQGRARELTRCARIFGCKEAVANPAGAVTLAFTTRNTSAEAGRLLATFGQPAPATGKRSRSLDERMADTKKPDIGASGGPAGGPSMAQQIIAAGRKRRGEA